MKDINENKTYKTKLCRFYKEYNKCNNEADCDFAHGECELRCFFDEKCINEKCKRIHNNKNKEKDQINIEKENNDNNNDFPKLEKNKSDKNDKYEKNIKHKDCENELLYSDIIKKEIQKKDSLNDNTVENVDWADIMYEDDRLNEKNKDYDDNINNHDINFSLNIDGIDVNIRDNENDHKNKNYDENTNILINKFEDFSKIYIEKIKNNINIKFKEDHYKLNFQLNEILSKIKLFKQNFNDINYILNKNQ